MKRYRARTLLRYSVRIKPTDSKDVVSWCKENIGPVYGNWDCGYRQWSDGSFKFRFRYKRHATLFKMVWL